VLVPGGESGFARKFVVRRWVRFKSLLALRVDAGSLALFRIAFGLVMALESYSLLRPSASTHGRVMLETYYTGADVTFNLPYAWFEWLPFIQGRLLYGIVLLMGLAAVTMAAGLFYRISATIVFLIWGYLYAVEATRTYWMSYYYLELLIAFLLIWMPADRAYTLVSWKKLRYPGTVPFWTVLLLRAQLVIAYFYAGVAKLNADWLFDAMPVHEFVARSPFSARVASFLSPGQLVSLKSFLESNGLAYFLSYAGAFFDLTIGPLLLWRRTRLFGMILLVTFHSFNHIILFDDLLWFPLLGIVSATIFLEPDWPEQLFSRVRRKRATTATPVPTTTVTESPLLQLHPIIPALVVTWVTIQTLIPLRHYFIPGDGRFTWEGLSFSWRLKADWYKCSPAEITLSDSAIISRDSSGPIRIDWKNWQGEKVIYRQVSPGHINWSTLPELVMLSEPELGERIIFNPWAGISDPKNLPTEPTARARVDALWLERYHHPPQTVKRTFSSAELSKAFASIVEKKKLGTLTTNETENLAAFIEFFGARGNGKGVAALRQLHPFGLQTDLTFSGPFLLVEDPALFHELQPHLFAINRDLAAPTDHVSSGEYLHLGADPLIIYTPPLVFDTRTRLPQACIVDSLADPEEMPVISWDPRNDWSISKGMHISTNPFLLHRYARRVAALWEKQYGRRPALHAKAVVSLNQHPPQLLVDPGADLASVPVSHFAHNRWIRDLQPDQGPAQISTGSPRDFTAHHVP